MRLRSRSRSTGAPRVLPSGAEPGIATPGPHRPAYLASITIGNLLSQRPTDSAQTEASQRSASSVLARRVNCRHCRRAMQTAAAGSHRAGGLREEDDADDDDDDDEIDTLDIETERRAGNLISTRRRRRRPTTTGSPPLSASSAVREGVSHLRRAHSSGAARLTFDLVLARPRMASAALPRPLMLRASERADEHRFGPRAANGIGGALEWPSC